MRALIWAAVSSPEQAADEQMSLETQERRGRELCEREGWFITDVLRVPGYSRRYFTIAECAADMRKAGCYAFDDLMKYIDDRAFDVFICRDAERFGREDSIVHEVTGRIYSIGAKIYAYEDGGMIPQDQRRWWGAYAGMKAATQIDSLVKKRHDGLRKKAERGLPASGKPPLSHLVISEKVVTERGTLKRNERLIVDESKRTLFEHAAGVLLEGVQWRDIESELYRRYGYLSSLTGRPYSRQSFYGVFHHPVFWGHGVYGFSPKNGTRVYGLWCFDPLVRVPDGVSVFWNSHEPMFQGELAMLVQDEMRRRTEEIRGKALPYRTHPFKGLIICGECGYAATVKTSKRADKSYVYYYGCNSPRDMGTNCQNRTSIRVSAAQAVVNSHLQDLFSGKSLQDLLRTDGRFTPTVNQLAEVEQQLEQARIQVQRLVRDHAQYGTLPGVDDAFKVELRQAGERVQILQSRREALAHQVGALSIQASQEAALESIRQLQLENFWTQPSTRVNQLLKRLFGHWRMVLLEGQIIGFTHQFKRRYSNG